MHSYKQAHGAALHEPLGMGLRDMSLPRREVTRLDQEGRGPPLLAAWQ